MKYDKMEKKIERIKEILFWIYAAAVAAAIIATS